MSDLWITLGPSSIDISDALFEQGVTGVRLTFSFGTPQLQLERAQALKKLAAAMGRTCTVIADLPGEKVRLGEFIGEPSFEVNIGDELRIACTDAENITATGVLPIRNKAFVAGLRPGADLVIGDGAAIIEVTGAVGEYVTARVSTGGIINQTRGVTVRNSDFEPSSLTDEDRSNLAFVAAHAEFDLVALSFVSSASDVEIARSILEEHGRSVPIVAKIESACGVASVEEICAHADMVMAARGDLALTLPWVELPAAVSTIADACAASRTPWILATQVAEGMERFAIPTRAEICDLAHWLQRGCAAVMLSYETVFGTNAMGAVRSVSELMERWGGVPAQ